MILLSVFLIVHQALATKKLKFLLLITKYDGINEHGSRPHPCPKVSAPSLGLKIWETLI